MVIITVIVLMGMLQTGNHNYRLREMEKETLSLVERHIIILQALQNGSIANHLWWSAAECDHNVEILKKIGHYYTIS